MSKQKGKNMNGIENFVGRMISFTGNTHTSEGEETVTIQSKIHDQGYIDDYTIAFLIETPGMNPSMQWVDIEISEDGELVGCTITGEADDAP